MAQQGLMCVWQALSSSNPSLQGEACEKGVLRTLTTKFYLIPHTRGSVSVFDDVFRDYDVITLEQYYSFINDHLRDPSYAMCLLEDEIEQVCWDLSKGAIQQEGYETRHILKQLWQIFGRLCEIGSLPAVLQSLELEWFVKKLKLDVTSPKTDLTFLQFLELIDINGLQQSDKIDSLQKRIDSVHSWMVREVLMTGWMWKRTRKQANWTSWLKRWFVLTPGQLAYYDGPKLKDRKGAVDITSRTSVTDLPDTRRFGWRLTGCFGLENRPFLQVELSTMDDAEKGAWMTALMEVKGAVQEGSTPMKRALSRRLKSGNKSNLLELPFMRPRSKSPAEMVRPPSNKMKKLRCTNCNEGVKSRRHISVKEPVLQRRLRKMTSIPEDQKQKIRNIFFSIDKDGNGKIDREEFSQFLTKLGLELCPREVELIFENIQGKQNGKITMEGFYIYFVKTILHESSSTCAERRLRAAFLDADRNHTGTINFREFVEYVWERRRSVRISRVLRTFEEMDKDGNGEVEYSEFLDFLRQDPSFCEELSLNISSDEDTDSSDDHGDEDEDNNNDDSGDTGDLVHQAEELQRVLYEDESTDDPKVMVDFLRKRWNAFVSFKRPGASGDIVMKGKSGIISDVLPGEHKLLDLAAFSDLPPLIPKHAHLQNVVWESADLSDCNSHGRVIFPADFDGVIPVQIATTELLRFYGCSLANAATMTVSLMYRHAIQDFTYENQYINEFVANKQKQAGAGVEKHDFSHLDMPLDDAGGYMVLAKLEDGEMHLTAFIVPTRHCLYLPGGTIHSNDYLKGTWRTMLSDEAPIDHCHITRRSDTAQGGLEKFIFTFK